MRPVSAVTRLWVGLLALAGIAGAHALAFLFVAPDPHARLHLLEATGHSAWYWPAAALVAGALAASVGGVARRFLGSCPTPGRSWVGVGVGLALLQVTGFIGLEAAERVLVGGSPLQIVSEPVVAVGVVAQILVALLITLVLSFAVEVIARLKGRTGDLSESQREPARFPAVVVRSRRLSLLRTAWGTRGPPLRPVF